MAYGNNGAEFQWNYMGGQNQGGYPQMGQMAMGGGSSGGYGGGSQQWLHSNQNHAQTQGQAPPVSTYQGHQPFEDYNQSMMRYTKVSEGSMNQDMGQGSMGMSPMGGSGYGGNAGAGTRISGGGGYNAGMSRNGLGNPSVRMGHGAPGNFGGNSW